MTSFTPIPKPIEDVVEQGGRSRRDFLKTSGMLVVSVGVAALGDSAMLAAQSGAPAAGPYPDRDFRQLDS